jgi:hypothetical protein
MPSIKNIFISTLVIVGVAGCGAMSVGTNHYLTDTVSLFGAKQIPNETCQKLGKIPEIKSITENLIGYIAEFSCVDAVSPNASQARNTGAQPVSRTTVNLEEAASKCRELGFTPQTERFGQCVLQLTR